MGMGKLSMFCGCARRVGGCLQLEKPEDPSGAQILFLTPWKGSLGGYSWSPTPAQPPPRRREEIQPASFSIWVKLESNNCKGNMNGASQAV